MCIWVLVFNINFAYYIWEKSEVNKFNEWYIQLAKKERTYEPNSKLDKTYKIFFKVNAYFFHLFQRLNYISQSDIILKDVSITWAADLFSTKDWRLILLLLSAKLFQMLRGIWTHLAISKIFCPNKCRSFTH